MEDDYSKYPETSGTTDKNGRTIETETYDRGNYTETITKVTNTKGDVNIYHDKTAK